MGDERIQNKLLKLLALACNTDSEPEALTAFKMARRIAIKNNIGIEASLKNNKPPPRQEENGEMTPWICRYSFLTTEYDNVICASCGGQFYCLHCIAHPQQDYFMEVCVYCAESYTRDFHGPRQRESKIMNNVVEKERLLSLSWRVSRKGNQHIEVAGRHIVIFRSKFSNNWTFSIDGKFSQNEYPKIDLAKSEALDVCLEKYIDVSQ